MTPHDGGHDSNTRLLWRHHSLWVLPKLNLLMTSFRASTNIAVFEAPLAVTRLAFLRDHCITHSPIFPGSGYFEAGAAAIAILQPQMQRTAGKEMSQSRTSAVLSGVTIPAPLRLEGAGATHSHMLQTSLQLLSGLLEISSGEAAAGRGCTLHAKGYAAAAYEAVMSLPAAAVLPAQSDSTNASSNGMHAAQTMARVLNLADCQPEDRAAAVGAVAGSSATTHPAADGFTCHPAIGDNILQLGQTLISPDEDESTGQQPPGVFVPAALGAFMVRDPRKPSVTAECHDIWAAIGPAAGEPEVGTHSTHPLHQPTQVTSDAKAAGDGRSGTYCTASRLTCKRMNLQASHNALQRLPPPVHAAVHPFHREPAASSDVGEATFTLSPAADCCYQIAWQAEHPQPAAALARASRTTHPYRSRGMKLLGSFPHGASRAVSGSRPMASVLALVQGCLGVSQEGNSSARSGSSTPGILLRGHASGLSGCTTSQSQTSASSVLPSLHALLKAAAQEGTLTASCGMSDAHSPALGRQKAGEIALSVFNQGKWVPGDLHGSHVTGGAAFHPLLVRMHAQTATPLTSSSMSSEGRFQLVPSPRGRLNSLKPAAVEASPMTLGAHEVLVAVEAVGLNFRDVLNVLGLYPGDAGMPGSDVAGRIAAGRISDGDGNVLAGPGDAVLGLTTGALASHVVCSAQTMVNHTDSCRTENVLSCVSGVR